MQKNYSVQQIDAPNVPMASLGKCRFFFQSKERLQDEDFSSLTVASKEDIFL